MEINYLDIFSNMSGLGTLLHAFVTFVLFIYFVYAFLVVRQVKLLNKSFKTDASLILKSFAYGHFLATLLLLLFTVATIF